MKIANALSKLITIALLSGMILMSSCSKDDPVAPSQQAAPEIPPLSTLEMDFSSFDTTGTSKLGKITGNGDQIRSDNNWRLAALKLGAWNLVLTINLVVPVAAFKASFTQTPEIQDDGSWTWSYNFGIGQSAELTARPSGGNIIWEMRISKPNTYTDFLWFTGESNITATEGSWQLFLNPQNPQPYLNIVWHRDPENGTADIRYTNVLAGDPGNGGSIFAAVTNDAPHDAIYQIRNTAINNEVDIEWSRTDFSGRIRDILVFSDTDWHCWDSNFQDVDCN